MLSKSFLALSLGLGLAFVSVDASAIGRRHCGSACNSAGCTTPQGCTTETPAQQPVVAEAPACTSYGCGTRVHHRRVFRRGCGRGCR